MSNVITINGNLRMNNYGQLIYDTNQEHFHTWNEEMDYIINEYPIRNPLYEYTDNPFYRIRTLAPESKLTKRQKIGLKYDPWMRPVRHWKPAVTVDADSSFARLYGRGPFEWLDTHDGIDFRWTTIENKGIIFAKLAW